MIVLLLIVAALPHVYNDVVRRGTGVDIDEGFQVIMARNYADSGVAGVPTGSTDIAAPVVLTPMSNWPPTYPALLVGLTRLGSTWTAALLAIKILLVITATFGWFLLGRRVVPPVAAAALVIPIIYRLSPNPTDLLCGAIAPFLMILLLRNATRRRIGFGIVLPASAAVLAFVAMKYSALYFIPGVFLVLSFQSWKRGSLRRDVVWNAATVLPAALVFAMIFNATGVPTIIDSNTPTEEEAETEATDVVVDKMSQQRIARVLTVPISTFLGGTFRSTSAVNKAVVALADRTPISWRIWKSTLIVILWAGMLIPLFVFYRRLSRNEPMRRFIEIVILIGVSAGLFLIAVDIFRGDSGYGNVYRYYSPVSVSLIIIYGRLLYDFLRSSSVWDRLMGAFLALLIVPTLLVHVGRRVVDDYATKDLRHAEGMAFVSETTRELKGDEPAVYFGHVGAFCLLDLPVQHFKVPTITFRDRITSSDSLWLFVLHNPQSTLPRYTAFAEQMRKEHDMQMREHNGWQVIYKKVGPAAEN